MKFYKIRNTKTGLYSTGGVWPRWSKLGRVFNTIGHLKSHLNPFRNDEFMKEAYKEAEVIELETIENWIIPVQRFIEKGTDIVEHQ
jgi:hypothetical protein